MRTSAHQLLGVLAVTAMSVTQCDQQDTSDWLIVDNRTDSFVVVTSTLPDGVHQIGSIGPGSKGKGVGGIEYCDSRPLEARVESVDGPVIDRRPASAGEKCVEVWVIEDR